MKPKHKEQKKKIVEPLDDFGITPSMIKDLIEGVSSNFWVTFSKLLRDEKEIAEVAVFENEALDEKQRDQLRLRRNLLQYVLDLPALVIEKSKPRPEQPEIKFNTYDE